MVVNGDKERRKKKTKKGKEKKKVKHILVFLLPNFKAGI